MNYIENSNKNLVIKKKKEIPNKFLDESTDQKKKSH